MKYWIVILITMTLVACNDGDGEDDGSDIPERTTNYRVDFAPEMVIGGTAAPDTVTVAANISSQQRVGNYAAGSVTVSGTSATAVTINQGYAGENGPVVVTLNNAGGGRWNVPATEIDFDALYRLEAAGYYISIQSPDGELRGQIVPPGWVVSIIDLDADSVVPSSTSSGTAKAGLSINPTTGTYRTRITISGVSDVINAAIHNAIAGARGDVTINLEQSATDPNVWGSRDINDINFDGFLTQIGLNMLASGALYFGIDSATNMNGDLRGQIVDDSFDMFVIQLSTAQVVGSPVVSDATGIATVTWVESLSRFGVAVNTNITNALGVFVHQGAPGSNGPVLFTLTPDSLLPGNWVLAPTDLNADETTAFLNGEFYITVQTPAYPGGELRGQLDPDFIVVTPYTYQHNFGTTHLSSVRGHHTATLLNDGRVLIIGGSDGSSHLDSTEIYDPLVAKFSPLANPMTSVRSGHTATLLHDGTVLITGGYTGNTFSRVDTAELYNPTDGSFTPLPNTMTSVRAYHTATLLHDGTVLITGGRNSSNAYLDTAEIYNPSDGSFTPVVNTMTRARADHTAVLLNDGTVLITGGLDGSVYFDTAELYNPADGSFTLLPNTMTSTRAYHTATLLNDGTVLITGGRNSNNAYLDTAEIYNPSDGSFTPIVNTMIHARAYHTAILLNDGMVLITGGKVGSAFVDTAEIYNPSNDSFTPLITPSLITARSRHTATLLNDNTVLFTGGWNGSTWLSDSAIYDPSDGSVTSLASPMTSAFGYHTATLLNDGTVLLTGGYNHNGDTYVYSAEIYDPTDYSFWPVNNPMTSVRGDHAASLLNDGTVLITGGWNGIAYLDTAEIYDPSDGSFTPVADTMTSVRGRHTSTLLNDGTVLIAGGLNGNGLLSNAEIYDPSDNSFTPVANAMNSVRGFHAATLLNDGTVLFTGGFANNTYTDTAEVYDPIDASFTPVVSPMTSVRSDHTATLLNDGTVMITGGYNGATYVDTVEFFY